MFYTPVKYGFLTNQGVRRVLSILKYGIYFRTSILKAQIFAASALVTSFNEQNLAEIKY